MCWQRLERQKQTSYKLTMKVRERFVDCRRLRSNDASTTSGHALRNEAHEAKLQRNRIQNRGQKWWNLKTCVRWALFSFDRWIKVTKFWRSRCTNLNLSKNDTTLLVRRHFEGSNICEYFMKILCYKAILSDLKSWKSIETKYKSNMNIDSWKQRPCRDTECEAKCNATE